MLSESQRIEIELNILKVASEFLKTGASIKEVANVTGVAPSSVQRYLKDERIIELLGQVEYEQIQKRLKERKMEALSRGGKNSANNNELLRDDLGHFIGSRRK